jgi:hypothetical protein
MPRSVNMVTNTGPKTSKFIALTGSLGLCMRGARAICTVVTSIGWQLLDPPKRDASGAEATESSELMGSLSPASNASLLKPGRSSLGTPSKMVSEGRSARGAHGALATSDLYCDPAINLSGPSEDVHGDATWQQAIGQLGAVRCHQGTIQRVVNDQVMTLPWEVWQLEGTRSVIVATHGPERTCVQCYSVLEDGLGVATLSVEDAATQNNRLGSNGYIRTDRSKDVTGTFENHLSAIDEMARGRNTAIAEFLDEEAILIALYGMRAAAACQNQYGIKPQAAEPREYGRFVFPRGPVSPMPQLATA